MVFHLHIWNGYLCTRLFQDHCCNYKRLLVKVLLIDYIYTISHMIEGEFGIVYRGLLTPDGDIINGAPVPVAVKTLKGQ